MQERIPYREIYWNIPGNAGQIFLYLLVTFATIIMTVGIMRDIARWRSGRPDMRIGELPARTRELLVQIFGQQRVLRRYWPGMMHLLIFAGFLALFIGTDIIAVEEDFTIPLMGPAAGQILVGGFYQVYEVVLDTLGLIFIGGLGWAWWRRYRHHPDRLDNRDTDAWVLGVLLFLGTGGFLLEGLRLANQTLGAAEIPVYTQAWARLSYVGFGLATVFRSIGLGDGSPVGLVLHQLLWFTHALATAAFIATLPFSKFKHIFYTPLNTFFYQHKPRGALDPIPNFAAEIEQDAPRLGLATLADLPWKRRLDLDACMRCGRCQAVCPAYAGGADLSPKWLITKMHDLMHGEPVQSSDGTIRSIRDLATDRAVDPETPGAVPLYGPLFTENEIWSCTTCRACMQECPAMIEHVDDIVDVRRHQTMIAGEVPPGVKQVLEGIESAGNPWQLPAGDRTTWAAGLEVPLLAEKQQVDLLYWVGCAPSYDDRSKRVARAMVELLQAADVDFAILGEEETCTGDPARRMGEELLYQAQAETNIATMQQYSFKQVVTTCAHCFNTLKHEYPQFGGGAGTEYEVVHHTDLLAQLIGQGRLQLNHPVNERVVYHDPCYIGRYNEIYATPRAVLAGIPGVELVEAPDANRERAMCCGGGGGNVWMEGWGKAGINTIRLGQLCAAEPQTLALACPFCMIMFEDAAKNAGMDETPARKDVAELVLEAVRGRA